MNRPAETSRWIIIINKVPRGPLSKDEIRLLLEEGVVRINDVAFKVPAENEAPSEWKFLWQFVEFERRSQERQSVVTVLPEQDRRNPQSSEQAQQAIKAVLPKELADISPEQLVDISPEQLVLTSNKSTPGTVIVENQGGEFPLIHSFQKSWDWFGRNFFRMTAVGLTFAVLGIYSLYRNPTSEVAAPQGSRAPTTSQVAPPSQYSPPIGTPLKGTGRAPEAAPTRNFVIPKATEAYSPPPPRDEPNRRDRDSGEIPPPEDRYADEEEDFDRLENGFDEPTAAPTNRARGNRRPATRKRRAPEPPPPAEEEYPPDEEDPSDY